MAAVDVESAPVVAVAVEAIAEPIIEPAAQVETAPPVEKKMIPNPSRVRQALMAKNFHITAWRQAAKQLNYLKKEQEFKSIPKKGTAEYEECKKKAAELIAEWKAAGAIPEEFCSKVNAPEMVDEAEYLAARERRKKMQETRKANLEEKKKIEALKKEAEAKGEVFVAPKKTRPSRKRKAPEQKAEKKEGEQENEKENVPAVPAGEGAAAEAVDKSADKPAAKPKKQRKPRAKKPKKEQEADAAVQPVVEISEQPKPAEDVKFEAVSADAKADFLPVAAASGN
jgi:hypothetical protein